MSRIFQSPGGAALAIGIENCGGTIALPRVDFFYPTRIAISQGLKISLALFKSSASPQASAEHVSDSDFDKQKELSILFFMAKFRFSFLFY